MNEFEEWNEFTEWNSEEEWNSAEEFPLLEFVPELASSLPAQDEEWSGRRRPYAPSRGRRRSATPGRSTRAFPPQGRRRSASHAAPPPSRRQPRRRYRRAGYNWGNVAVATPLLPPAPSNPEYIRWVQSALNQILGVRLPLDGIMGAATRSALRSFQERMGLPVDGTVGPDTEQALLNARQGSPATAGFEEPAVADEAYLDVAGAQEEGEVDRRSAAYGRWVQQALNRVLGLRLAVDGIIGPQTRSAIRTFQSRKGLVVDGIVGPQTEAKLIAAGAGNPPGSSSQPTVPTTPIQPPTTGQQLRTNIAQLARQEWQRWQQGTRQECEPAMRATLEGYWRSGVGYVPSQANYCSSVAWSAAFISWVMRSAGAGTAFRYSARHTDYVGAAKQNRVAGNTNPFKTYRLSEAAPRVGDLVCKEREKSGVTYDNVDQGSYSSHCDIVVAVEPGRLKTIGGNVSNSVKETAVAIDASGHITAPGYYAVVRVGS